MDGNTYSLSGIHLPENKALTKRLATISKTLSIVLLFCGATAVVGWLLRSAILQGVFFDSFPLDPMTAIALMLTTISLLLEDFPRFSVPKNKQWGKNVHLASTIILSILIIAIGIQHANYYFTTNNIGLDKIFFNSLDTKQQAHIIISLNVVLVGLALLTARTRINHRYHLTQFLALCMLVISSTTILGYVYSPFFPSSFSRIVYMPLNAAVIFFLLSIAVSFRWSNRGFIGIFTVDSVSSNFSIQLLFSKVFFVAAVGFLSLIGAWIHVYNYHESIIVFAILTMTLSTCFAWLNTKLVYKIELERFLMREELKIHNISLALGNEELTSRMGDLEEEHKVIIDKLNNKEKYKDAVSGQE